MRTLNTALFTLAVVVIAGLTGPGAAAETTGSRGLFSRGSWSRPGAPSQAAPQASAPATTGSRIVAYYFHGNKRCVTCMAIEENSHKAVESALAGELKSGRAEWRTLNYEERENRHYAKEFKLAFPTVVLVEERNGATARWKNLDQAWTKVRESHAALQAYVSEEAKVFAAGPPVQ